MHWRLKRLQGQLIDIRKRWDRFAWQFRSADFPRDPLGLVRLHVGCGDIDAPGYVNVDARKKPHVHIVCKDLFRLRMVADGAASLVYMCHVLEHVPHAQVHSVLKEMRRVLAPGGILRLSVPDFDHLLTIYSDNDGDPATILAPLMGGQDYAFNFHYTIFTARSLSNALLRAGFSEVCSWNPKTCNEPPIDDWSGRPIYIGGKAYPVSLNLEAFAPTSR